MRILRILFYPLFCTLLLAPAAWAQSSSASDARDAGTLTTAALIDSARTAIQDSCATGVFSGAALIARGDEVLLETACGEASKRYHVPNTVGTRFNMASMGKMFTGVAVAQLVEAGKLSYDEPIRAYVDETWLPPAITEKVTIHHLLSHTSGLGSYFNDAFLHTARADMREVDDYKPLVRGDTLAFEPGERFRYSNIGMHLLGVVIERVTGQSYEDYVREHIFAPAGMDDTGFFEMDEPVENLAMGYVRDPDSPYGWRNNLFVHVIKGGPAGGGFSTVGDMFRFARALQDGVLVSPETLERLWTPHVTIRPGFAYGYGFGIIDGPAGTVVGHNGGFPGINGQMDLYLDSGFAVVTFANAGEGSATRLARQIGRWVAQVPGS